MEIPSIQDLIAQSQANKAATTSTPSAAEDLKTKYNNFLLLLTKQLQNQDPMSPMDTAAFTQQLVSFSNVEQQIQANQRLEKLISLQSSTNAFGAVNFVGNAIAVDSDRVALKDGKAGFQYQIEHSAAKAMMRVIDSRGQTVLVQEANRGVGTYNVDWNGKDAFGNQLPDGEYRIAVSYEDDQGKAYSAKITSFGVVDSTEIKDGTVKLFVGNTGYALDKVLRVGKPATMTGSNT
jgi:flagellar basal-body rod modification protein FlgD